MAYDKVVDSAVLDAGLKQIADAIREKGGTSDNLAFPTAMAEAIVAIGGGGRNLYSGTVVAESKMTVSSYQFSLSTFGGTVPEYLFFWKTSPTDLKDATDGYSMLHCMFHVTGGGTSYYYATGETICFALNSTAKGSAPEINTNQLMFRKETGDYLKLYGISSSFYMYAGHEYAWFAISSEL